MTRLQPKPVRLAGSLSHGDWLNETFTFPAASAAPPAHGGGAASADAPPPVASGAASTGFTLHPADTSVWAALTQPEGYGCPQDMGELLAALAASPELRSAALLRSMERLRDVLDQLPTHAPLDHQLTVPAADLLVLVRALLNRLR